MTETTPQPMRQRMLRSGGIVLFFTILTSPFAYLIRVLLARTLSIHDFGLYYAVLALVSVLPVFADLGFGFSVEYLVPKFLRQKDFQSIWQVFMYESIIEVSVASLMAIIWYFLANWLAVHYFKVPSATFLIRILSIYLIVNSIFSSILRLIIGLQRETLYVLADFIRSVLAFGMLAAAIAFGLQNVVTDSYIWSATFLMMALIYLVILRLVFPYIKSKVSWNPKLFTHMAHIAGPSLLTTATNLMIISVDVLFLTAFRNVTEVGIYNIILPLISIPMLLLTPIFRYLMPMISHLHEDKDGKIKTLLESLLVLIPFMGLYFATFLITYPSATISLLFGRQWQGLVERPLALLSLVYLLNIVGTLLFTVISGLGMVRERARLSVVIAIVNMVVCGVSVYFWGISGIIVANLITFILSIILYARVIRTRIEFGFPFKQYLKFILIFSGFWAVNRLFGFSPQTLLIFILTGIVYTVLVVGFAVQQKLFDPRWLTSKLIRKQFVKFDL